MVLVIVFSILTVVQISPVSASPYTTKIFSSGDDLVHGSTYFNDFLWFSTRTNPSRVIKMNGTTLDYQKVTLTGSQFAEDLVSANGYIWVPIYDNPSELVKVNPTSLSWERVITFDPMPGESGFAFAGSALYDFDYLWLGGQSKLCRVNTTDLSYTLYNYGAEISTDRIHGLTSGNGYIWATTYLGIVLRIDPSNPTTKTYTDTGRVISDDIAFANGYLYFGTEETAPRIYRVNGDNVSDYTYSQVGDDKCYGVLEHDSKIWAFYKGSPGTMYRMDLGLNVEMKVVLPTGYNDANELVFDNENFKYVTCFLEPTRLVKYSPFMYKLTIDSIPTNISFSLNGTSHNTTYSEGLENGTYQINFTSSFEKAGLTWNFAYWNDNTSNTNPVRTIDLQSDMNFSVTYYNYQLNLRTLDANNNSISGATAYANATTKTSSSTGWANFTLLNATYNIKVKLQDVWVNGTWQVTMDSNKTFNVSCTVYSLAVYITDIHGEEKSGASLNLSRSDVGGLNGLYGLPSSPTASYHNSTHAKYVWSQLANQTTSYTVTAAIGGQSASTNTTLTSNTEIVITLPGGTVASQDGEYTQLDEELEEYLEPVKPPIPPEIEEILPYGAILVVALILAVPIIGYKMESRKSRTQKIRRPEKREKKKKRKDLRKAWEQTW